MKLSIAYNRLALVGVLLSVSFMLGGCPPPNGGGETEGVGETEGTAEREGSGESEGTSEGEGTGEGEGTSEGEGTGEGEGTSEGERTGEDEGTGEGEGTSEGDGTGTITLERFAEGFELPVFAASHPADTTRFFVVEQSTGRIRIVSGGGILSTPFLDIGDKVIDQGNALGLLGMAFHPDYTDNGFFFVYYIDNEGNTVVERYTVSDDPNVADATSAKTIFTLEQNSVFHVGGMLAFGPTDGYFYIGLGDGGPMVPDVDPQSLASPLGAILRIDVDNGDPYAIPESNPFVGVPDAREEIWVYGLRNPWRFCFDSLTGDMYIADVGDASREEINFQPAGSSGGENYGWPVAEGFACIDGEGECGTDPAFVPPIHDYDRSGSSAAIIGGYVYRGADIPLLQGGYLFADYQLKELGMLRYEGNLVTELLELTVHERTGDGATVALELGRTSSFGQDARKELYILDYDAECLYKIVDFVPN